MPTRSSTLILGVAALNAAASYAALIWAPPEVTLGEAYRIFYLHFPTAIASYISFGLSLAASLLYLYRRRPAHDLFAEVTAIIGLLYAGIALVTGSIFSNIAWGAYWNWDPRQTTTLILWIAYGGYVALRASIENVDRRFQVSAVYNVFAFTTVPLSYLSVIFWQSLHPWIFQAGQGWGGLTGPSMQLTLLLNIAAAFALYSLLLHTLYRARRAERLLDMYEELSWR